MTLICCFASAVFAIFTPKQLAANAFQDSSDPSAMFVLHVDNRAHVPGDVLAVAMKEVERIYQHVGIQIVSRLEAEPQSAGLHDAPASKRFGQNALQVVVIVTPECISKQTCEDESVTGFAMGSEGRGLRRAYIFSNRIYEKALKFHKRMPVPNPEGLVMGCAIAHEVGHLLLPPGHTNAGLMGPQLDMNSIDDAIRGVLFFTPEQGELIRAALLNQTRRP